MMFLLLLRGSFERFAKIADVILIGEMRDLETIEAAITAAETGHLVFATLHTTGAARTAGSASMALPASARGQKIEFDFLPLFLLSFHNAYLAQ
jgi:Tfp pilus assembly ATPase PilU